MQASDIVSYEGSFQTDTFQNYLRGLMEYKNGNYLSSVLEAAVFLEALLKDILKESTSPKSNVTLGGLVSSLRKYTDDADKTDKENILKDILFTLGYSQEADQLKPLIDKLDHLVKKESTLNEKDRSLFKDIHYRCTDITSKRNRIIHDNGISRGDTMADAQDIYENGLDHIIKDYVETSFAKQICNMNQPNKDDAKGAKGTVFISTISPHTFEQEFFIEKFCKRLADLGITPIRCKLNDYDMEDPLAKVRSEIKKCDAVIVLGLNRVHSYHFVEKEGANVKGVQSKEGMHRHFSSAWLQLESGIAAGLSKQIFVLCQQETHSEGIFDRVCYSYKPIEMDGPLDPCHNKVNLLLRKVEEYLLQKETKQHTEE